MFLWVLHAPVLMACVLLVSQGVAGEEGVRRPGAGVVAQAVGHHAAAEVATISREACHAKWVVC